MASKDVVVNVDEGNEDISPDQLEFHDLPHLSSDHELKSGKGKSNVQTHTFSDFPDQGDSEDDEDKAQLLTNGKKQPSFWTFEYYQAFFDVDSRQVLMRIVGSMLPNPRSNYLQTKIRPNPDLYGPFWICTTLVFTTAIAGNLANYISLAGRDYQWVYDFQKVTLAGTAVFVYWWVMPSLLYALLWWRGSQAGITFTEILCVYGYSLAIYVPISVLWAIPVSALRWILVIVGALLSGSVLVMTFWPAVREDDKKVSVISVSLIMLFHALLAVGFVLYFFHVPDLPMSTVEPPIGPPYPTASNIPIQNVTDAGRVPPGNVSLPQSANLEMHDQRDKNMNALNAMPGDYAQNGVKSDTDADAQQSLSVSNITAVTSNTHDVDQSTRGNNKTANTTASQSKLKNESPVAENIDKSNSTVVDPGESASSAAGGDSHKLTDSATQRTRKAQRKKQVHERAVSRQEGRTV